MKKFFLLLVIGIGMSYFGWGQTSFTATYTFTGTTGNVASFAYNGTTYDGITPGTIDKVGVTTSSSTSNFRATGWPTGATSGSDVFTGSVDLNKYIGFTISAVSGYKFTVTSITFGIGRSAAGTRQSEWRGSADSYGSIINNYTNLASGLTNSSGVLTNTDVNSSWTGNVLEPGTSYQNINTSIGFRYYLFNAETSAGTAGLQGAITITGTFETTAVPTTQAHDITFSGITTSGMTPSWTNGDGGKRVVIMNTTNSFTNPTDGTDPVADPVYGGSGEQVVYNNSSNSVAVSGLTASTTYWYRVYEYNGIGASTIYLTTTATGNPNSQATNGSATTPSITSPTATSITSSSAVLGGNITSDGGDAITARGTVWKTSTGVVITDNPLEEGGASTGIFSHSRSSLPAKTLIYYKAYATNGLGTTLTDEASFYTLADEPTTHVTGFSAASGGITSINLNWTGTATGADGYLILQRTGPAAPTGIPADATGYIVGNNIGDGTVAAIVIGGSELSKTISSLSPLTQYSFTIIPYAWDGSNAQTYNYYTAATIPSASATTDAPPATTYTWVGADNASWAVASSWNPERTVPANNDILQFNDGSTKTITAVPAQTIGQLLLNGNTTINLQASGGNTLTIGGESGTDFDVPTGSSLNISGTNALTISLSTGVTGSISGTITFSGGGHKLTAAASGVTFNSGGAFTAGTGFSGNPFGTTPYNAIIFADGSTYTHIAGSNPFGASAPNSVVTFQPGSLFKLTANLSPSLSGRTYGNFEIDFPAFSQSNMTGGSAFVCNNLTITNATTVNMNLTGGMTINGNITVTNGSLGFSPASISSLTLSGTTTQTISGAGTLTFGSNLNVTINSTTIADRDITFSGSLTVNSGKSFTVNSGKNVTVTGTITIVN